MRWPNHRPKLALPRRWQHGERAPAPVAPSVLAGRRIEVRGTVQGVGFRPWVYRLAREEGIGGRVWNDPRGVTIEAFGTASQLDLFVRRLRAEPPPAGPRPRADLRAHPPRARP